MVYVQIKNGYITDCVSYPYADYIPVEAVNPPDIMCGCYQLMGGAFVLDEDKYAEWLAEQEKPAAEAEPVDPIAELAALLIDQEYRLTMLELGGI